MTFESHCGKSCPHSAAMPGRQENGWKANSGRANDSVGQLAGVRGLTLLTLVPDKPKEAFGGESGSVLRPRAHVDLCAVQREVKLSTANAHGAELPGGVAVLLHGLDEKDHLGLSFVGDYKD